MSTVLPALDLKLLTRFIDEPSQPKAARAYRAALMRKKHGRLFGAAPSTAAGATLG